METNRGFAEELDPVAGRDMPDSSQMTGAAEPVGETGNAGSGMGEMNGMTTEMATGMMGEMQENSTPPRFPLFDPSGTPADMENGENPDFSSNFPSHSSAEPSSASSGTMIDVYTNETSCPISMMRQSDAGNDSSSNSSCASVRLLNAVTDGSALRATLGNRLLLTSLTPGTWSGYFSVHAGFRVLTLYDAQYPWMIVYRAALPFSPGERATLAVVRCGSNLDIVRVDDRNCVCQGTNRACIRTINLVYNSPPFDVVLTDGRVVFTDVRFKEVTTYRRAWPGTYDMYLAQTPATDTGTQIDIETVEEMPIVVQNCFLPSCGVMEPLASFFLEARSGASENIYLMGNWNQSQNIHVRVIENY